MSRLVDDDSPTLIEQLRPAMADDDPEDYERYLWATLVLVELEEPQPPSRRPRRGR